MTLEEMFSTFKKSAKRLEMLQEYHMDGGEWDTFQNYCEGKPVTPFDELKEWNEQLLKWTKEGKKIERIRMIDSPLSIYLKYEIDLGYLVSSFYGQTVKFVSKKNLDQLNKKKITKDFWIFDDSVAFDMIYDDMGKFIGSVESEITTRMELFDKLSDVAIQMEDIVKQVRQNEIHIVL